MKFTEHIHGHKGENPFLMSLPWRITPRTCYHYYWRGFNHQYVFNCIQLLVGRSEWFVVNCFWQVPPAYSYVCFVSPKGTQSKLFYLSSIIHQSAIWLCFSLLIFLTFSKSLCDCAHSASHHQRSSSISAASLQSSETSIPLFFTVLRLRPVPWIAGWISALLYFLF